MVQVKYLFSDPPLFYNITYCVSYLDEVQETKSCKAQHLSNDVAIRVFAI